MNKIYKAPIHTSPKGLRVRVVTVQQKSRSLPSNPDTQTGQIEYRAAGELYFHAFNRRSRFGRKADGLTATSEHQMLCKLRALEF